MVRLILKTTIYTLVLVAYVAGAAHSQEREYEEYRRPVTHREYFEITFDREHFEITAEVDSEFVNARFKIGQITTSKNAVYADQNVLFDAEGVHLANLTLPYDKIDDSRVREFKDYVVITFFTRVGGAERVSRMRQGNIITPFSGVSIGPDRFVRGLIFSVTGNIEVHGEVNKDVISLFGNIRVTEEAVIRGDIVTVTGEPDIYAEATIYGDVFTSEDSGRRRYRNWRQRSHFDVGVDFDYNRVDGATGFVTSKFRDADSLLPSFHAAVGYALEAERGRFRVGLEQAILRDPALVAGGEYYRRLATEDDWLLSGKENLIFALLVTEDFRDYYEAEGATGYLKAVPARDLELELRYRYEQTNWLQAHRHLFSLFGGDKLFRRNFSSVDPIFREAGALEIDTSANAGFTLSVSYDTRDSDDPFRTSAWYLTGSFEWSHPDLQSDFDYRRYVVGIRRYQKVHHRITLLMRGMYGGSDGHLPMYKQFFLGGLGTLRGYNHKEYYGTKFWMANLEYRTSFPKTDLGASVLWDFGEVANGASFAQAEIKHSLGIAVYLGDDFRMSLAKRLDRTSDDDPKIYVRFDHVF
jgi:hypothetical protein